MKMRKAERRELSQMAERLERARMAVYRFGDDNSTFSECLAKCSEDARAEYIIARDDLAMRESELIAQGKGYRNAWGGAVFW